QLMAVRPHPQILFPGDELELPEPPQGTDVSLDHRTTFRRRAKNTQPLRLVLEHIDGTAMAETEYTLEHERDTVKGTTDRSGVLDVELPIEVKSAKITAGEYTWDVDVAHLDP